MDFKFTANKKYCEHTGCDQWAFDFDGSLYGANQKQIQRIFFNTGGDIRPGVTTENSVGGPLDMKNYVNISDGQLHSIRWIIDLDNNKVYREVDGALVSVPANNINLFHDQALSSIVFTMKKHPSLSIYRLKTGKLGAAPYTVTAVAPEVNGGTYYIYSNSKAWNGQKALAYLKATNAGYEFAGWNVNGEFYSAEQLITPEITGNTTIQPVFRKITE